MKHKYAMERNTEYKPVYKNKRMAQASQNIIIFHTICLIGANKAESQRQGAAHS